MGTFGGTTWGGGPSTTGVVTSVPFKSLSYMALRLAGVTKFPDANAVAPSPDQLGDCLQVAQLMLDQASIKQAFVYSERLTTYVLGTLKQYTLGPGGTLVSTTGTSIRPIKLDRARLILNSTGTPVHLSIYEGSYQDFANLVVQDIPNALPKFLYCDYAIPAANIYLVPQDLGGDSLELYDWQSLPNVQTVNDLIAFPPGYQDWFVNNLAVRLADVFKESGASVSQNTILEARRSEAAIQRRNTKSPRMGSDVPTSGTHRGSDFNWMSGTPR